MRHWWTPSAFLSNILSQIVCLDEWHSREWVGCQGLALFSPSEWTFSPGMCIDATNACVPLLHFLPLVREAVLKKAMVETMALLPNERKEVRIRHTESLSLIMQASSGYYIDCM